MKSLISRPAFSKAFNQASGKAFGAAFGEEGGGDIPPSVPGLLYWYDPSDSKNIEVNAGKVIKLIDKQSGKNLVPVGNSEPEFESDGINGLGSMEFDGSNSEFLIHADLPFHISTTIFMVAKPTGVNNVNDSLISFDSSFGNDDFQIDANESGKFLFEFKSDNLGENSLVSGVDTLNEDTIYTIRLESSTNKINLRINGDAISESTNYNGNLDSPQDFRVGVNRGESQFIDALMGEILFYEGALSDEDIETIENYLKDKWIPAFTPARIADLEAWWDADDPSTIIEDGSNNLVQLTDKSGNINNFFPIGGSRPKTGLTTMKNRNVFNFDGVANGLKSTTFSTSAAMSIFVVFRPRGSANNNDPVFGFDGANKLEIAAGTSGKFEHNVDNTGLGFTDFKATYDGLALDFITGIILSDDDDKAILRLNGEENNSASSYTVALDASSTLRIGMAHGESEFLEFDFAEMVVYKKEISAAWILALENYFKEKWAVLPNLYPSNVLEYNPTLEVGLISTKVFNWQDQNKDEDGDGSNDASQGDDNDRPEFVVAGMAGHPEIQFDAGQGEFLDGSDSVSLDSITQEMTFIANINNDSPDNANTIFDKGVSNGWRIRRLPGDIIEFNAASSTQAPISFKSNEAFTGNADMTVMITVKAGGTVEFRENGKLRGSPILCNLTDIKVNNNQFGLGITNPSNPSSPMRGNIGRFAIFNKVLPIADLNLLGAAFSQYTKQLWNEIPDFNKDSVPGIVGWWDANDPETIEEADTVGKVSKWIDKSDGGHDLTATGSEQPSTNTAEVMNSLNTLSFDGVLNKFILDNFPITPDLAIFMVVHVKSTASEFDSIFSLNAVKDFQIDADVIGEFDFRVNLNGLTASPFKAHSDHLGLDTVMNVVFDVSDMSVTLNLNKIFENISTGYNGELDSPMTLGIGTNRGQSTQPECNISEIIIVNSALTADQILFINTYLYDKWILPYDAADIHSNVFYVDSAEQVMLGASPKVVGWGDVGNNGTNDAIQTVPANQPEHSFTSFNGRAGITFNNSALLASQSFMRILNNASLNFVGDFTIIAVLELLSSTNRRAIISKGGDDGWAFEVSGSERPIIRVASSTQGAVDYSSTNSVLQSIPLLLQMRFKVGGEVAFWNAGIPLGVFPTNNRTDVKANAVDMTMGIKAPTIAGDPANAIFSQIAVFDEALMASMLNPISENFAAIAGLEYTDIIETPPS